ncbi:MAG: heavy metal translocating P-type ATPase [Thermoanaerobacteraceae bacterium]|nr:heavy metal translocating P-type ATPase [Thermoanaerobacteraceae bacterium]
MEKKIYRLENLDCADCAEKLERAVASKDGIAGCTVSFASGKMMVTTDENADVDLIVKSTVRELEPEVTVITEKDADDDKEGNEENIRGRIITVVIGAVLLVVPMVFSLPLWLEVSLFVGSYIITGHMVLWRAFKNAVHLEFFDESFLMSVATLGAFAIGEYAEAIAVMLFYTIGELLEDMAVDRSRRSIKSLINIRPDYANLKRDDGVFTVNPKEVNVGDVIVVKPGERVPLDGVVQAGQASFDTSALTGESVPRSIGPGQEVLSGFIDTDALIELRVTREFGKSTVTRILELVENASSEKAPTERFITKFARYYTPVVVGLAALIAFIPPLFITGATLSEYIYRALVFLVISCPCALVLSVPLAFFGGIGRASREGILAKGGNYLEALNRVDSVVFDKTGTLTKGTFKVTEVVPRNGFGKEDVLKCAAIAEVNSSHPIARSIVEAYGKPVDEPMIKNYEEMSGTGIKAETDEGFILVGNDRMLHLENIEHSDCDINATVVYVALNRRYLGYITIADEPKDDSYKAIRSLKSLGVRKTVMLTGDNRYAAEYMAEKLGIDEHYAELLPQDKVAKLEELQRQKKKGSVVFVGDGINDAPVIARADVGVAMGALGSDAAVEAADIVLMNDNPYDLVKAIGIARRTNSIAWQNIVFALAVKGLFLIMGAFGIATMWESVFADTGVTIIAVLNSLRTLQKGGV